MRRGDGVRGTLLRKVPTHSREDDVLLQKEVMEGEAVTVMWREGDFAWVRAGDGVEGFLKSSYCHAEDDEGGASLGECPAHAAPMPTGGAGGGAAAPQPKLEKYFAALNQLKLG
jgi:hypothetical protein